MRIALHQPEIAGNVGTILRLGACLGLAVDVIEPCGFAFSDRALARAGMDYATRAIVTRHADWAAFRAAQRDPARLVLFTTAGDLRLPDVAFTADDVLLFGSEGSGAPPYVHDAATLRVRIPIAADARSLNLATACAIVAGEALRQTGGWPT
ncbi:tRNA (cytidine(34)-2'-O)-methyltransferase [Sphingomonas abietis]|uniref:tRNA (cytidine(34)-2'-O)-methyltransferase n=1 Tax=Sphingomonas abietis TaxID=3012344 RepID=A0ABY7NPL3_9SPHN|nr:tRNA (cytidine(34)-2'-O)-methyltransferase [Sphingomonas abietis]WBO23470.1 tRNA (cytidine(34)-2'-O)-methyltransferase [Sphingomonas abietis]